MAMGRRSRVPKLRVEVVCVPDPDYYRNLDKVLNILADAFADKLIAEARAEVAAELGIPEDQLMKGRGLPRVDVEQELLRLARPRRR